MGIAKSRGGEPPLPPGPKVIFQPVDLAWMSQDLYGRGIRRLMVEGGPRLVEETRRIVQAFGKGPHIFNLGHGISQYTPPEHVSALVEAVHGYRR